MRNLPQDSERDAALEGMLPHVSTYGWTWRAVRAGLRDPIAAGGRGAEAMFPGAGPEMIEAFCDLADRRMLEDAETLGPEMRPSQKLRAILALRLSRWRPHREAVRRAVAAFAVPSRVNLAGRCTYRTVDALWTASGDRSVDVSWYTKRASLAAVYTATVLFWLQDEDLTGEATLAFFDRRVAGLRAAGRWRARLARRS